MNFGNNLNCSDNHLFHFVYKLFDELGYENWHYYDLSVRLTCVVG